MFQTVPQILDTSGFDDWFYGKGTRVKVESITQFPSRESLLLIQASTQNINDEDYVPLYNTIGSTNLTLLDDHLIVQEAPLLGVFGFDKEYRDNNLYVDIRLQASLNPKLRGYKKYCNDIFLRPILITKSDTIKVGSDIIGVAGVQLLSRNNEQHNTLKPIMVRGVKYAKKIL